MSVGTCREPVPFPALAAAWIGLAAAFAPGPSHARPLAEIERSERLLLCAHPDALPQSARDASPAGWVVDVADALARALGVRLEPVWTTNLLAVRRTTCDLHVAVVDDEAPAAGDAVRPLRLTRPLLAVQSLLVRRGADAADASMARRAEAPVAASPRALRGVGAPVGAWPPQAPRGDASPAAAPDALGGDWLVAVPSGSWAHIQLQRRGVRLAVSLLEDDEILDAVRDGRVDAGVVSSMGLGWYRKRHPQAELQADAAPLQSMGLDLSLALGLRQADAATAAAMDAALGRLQDDGTLAAIGARYGLALGGRGPPAGVSRP